MNTLLARSTYKLIRIRHRFEFPLRQRNGKSGDTNIVKITVYYFVRRRGTELWYSGTCFCVVSGLCAYISSIAMNLCSSSDASRLNRVPKLHCLLRILEIQCDVLRYGHAATKLI